MLSIPQDPLLPPGDVPDDAATRLDAARMMVRLPLRAEYVYLRSELVLAALDADWGRIISHLYLMIATADVTAKRDGVGA